jgi:peptidoglycan/xylan/chitin deacetylase (PgdA/CDA1 family)
MIPICARGALSESLLLACEGWARFFVRPGIAILCYHRIVNDEAIATVTPCAFRRQMGLLRRWGYRAVGVEEVVSQLADGGPVPRRWVALTFDDGYRSFLTAASPVLREFGFTASVFVPTDYAGRQANWDEEGVASGEGVLSWEEMRELQGVGFRFYPHGVSHTHLTRLADDELARELLASRDAMEAQLGRAAPACCYPYGDYNARVMEAARAAGYLGACGLQPELNRSPDQLWDLRRFMVLRATTARGFHSRVTGAFGCYAGMRRLLRGGGSGPVH